MSAVLWYWKQFYCGRIICDWEWNISNNPLASFAAGSATTASGTSHFVVGMGNIESNLFAVGSGTDGNNTTAGGTGAASRNNAFTVRHSGT